jgi:hypothetical protein
MGAHPVTVRADNIALSDFSKRHIAPHLELFLSRTMVEIHANRMKPVTAIHAGHILER